MIQDDFQMIGDWWKIMDCFQMMDHDDSTDRKVLELGQGACDLDDSRLRSEPGKAAGGQIQRTTTCIWEGWETNQL